MADGWGWMAGTRGTSGRSSLIRPLTHPCHANSAQASMTMTCRGMEAGVSRGIDFCSRTTDNHTATINPEALANPLPLESPAGRVDGGTDLRVVRLGFAGASNALGGADERDARSDDRKPPDEAGHRRRRDGLKPGLQADPYRMPGRGETGAGQHDHRAAPLSERGQAGLSQPADHLQGQRGADGGRHAGHRLRTGSLGGHRPREGRRGLHRLFAGGVHADRTLRHARAADLGDVVPAPAVARAGTLGRLAERGLGR
jgi:hypothetical protein